MFPCKIIFIHSEYFYHSVTMSAKVNKWKSMIIDFHWKLFNTVIAKKIEQPALNSSSMLTGAKPLILEKLIGDYSSNKLKQANSKKDKIVK